MVEAVLQVVSAPARVEASEECGGAGGAKFVFRSSTVTS
jgi:hypothetical protein